MNVETFAESQLVLRLGWTLLHSLWQIALMATLLFFALRLLRTHSPNLRYILSVFTLAFSLILPVYTFVQFSPNTGTTATARDRNGLSIDSVKKESPPVGDLGSLTAPERSDSAYGAVAANFFSDVSRWFGVHVPNLFPVAVLLWFAGAGLFALRLVGGFAHLSGLRRTAATETDQYWVDAFARTRDRVGGGSMVRLLKSTSVQTPIAIGIFRPVILIPAALFLQITPRELETIIAHELVHIRRYDPLVNICQCVIESVFFYHPALWWISAQVRREREFAADAAVMEIFQDSHVTYARALANLEEIRLRTNQQTPRYATAANGGNFMQRIQRILKIKTEASMANSAWTAGLAFLLTSAFLLAIFLLSSSDRVNGQERAGTKKLAIGFVSVPPIDRTANAPKDADATARLLIQELKEHKVPATGFLQGGMISDGEKSFPVRAAIARMWIDAGFELGLGGFKHLELYNTPVDEYIANIEKNESVAKQLIGEMGLPPRYFSYPFLNAGKTIEDKAKVEAWLASRGYTSVKYTIDNQEWMYSYAYDMARNDNDVNTMKEIRKAYLDYMGRMFDHFEEYSSEMFGRDIPQTMVLTPSRLVTDTADDFFAMVAKRGYSLITVDEAQSDEAYKTREDFTGEAGISWFERWTLAKGNRLRKEPEVDHSIQKLWNERQAIGKK